jgi:hypothetical protein
MKTKSFSVVLTERIESKDRMKTKSFSVVAIRKEKLRQTSVRGSDQKRYDPIYLIPLCRCLFVRERIRDVRGFPCNLLKLRLFHHCAGGQGFVETRKFEGI